jgi:DNA-binding response OmpR family regulator
MPGDVRFKKILVIDDEPCIADTLAIILSTQSYDVQVAYSAEKAIEVLAEWPPDLAIVDVMLPQMNGIDLAIVIRANYPACSILLFSGQPDTSALLEEAWRKGHKFEILAKPLHPTFILDAVTRLLSSEQERPADA